MAGNISLKECSDQNMNNKEILNLGCGKGQNMPQIMNRGHITCVDTDRASIDMAKNKFPGCEFVCGKIEDIDLKKNYFDEVYCFDVLEHVDNLDLVMQKIRECLKQNGLLYVEIPYERSEKMLLGINPGYFDQIGHKRIFPYKELEKTFNNFGFQVISQTRSRGIVNLYLWTLFKLKINISDQMGTVKNKNRIIERALFLVMIWFDKNLFNTFLKWIPLWIITMPIGALISQIYPKTIILILKKAE